MREGIVARSVYEDDTAVRVHADDVQRLARLELRWLTSEIRCRTLSGGNNGLAKLFSMAEIHICLVASSE